MAENGCILPKNCKHCPAAANLAPKFSWLWVAGAPPQTPVFDTRELHQSAQHVTQLTQFLAKILSLVQAPPLTKSWLRACFTQNP